MASSGLQSARGLSNTDDEPSSVELEFGNEFSEETLNILRSLDRPNYLEESSSLDPAEDVGDYIDNQLNLPPAAYDAVQEAGRAEMEAMAAAYNADAEPATQATVRYRQRLAEGASHEDLTWLKLRAYHRAKAHLDTSKHQQEADQRQGLLDEYEVPDDRVPAQLLHLTPEQLAERHFLAAVAAARLQKAAEKRRSVVERILAAPEPSSESEWDVAPRDLIASAAPSAAAQRQPPASLLQGVVNALGQHTGLLQLRPHTPQQPIEATFADDDSVLPAAVEEREKMPRRTVYTHAYLEQQRLEQQLSRQQRQRSVAFWASFLTASGVYVVRMLRGSKRGKRSGGRLSSSSGVKASGKTGEGAPRGSGGGVAPGGPPSSSSSRRVSSQL